MFSIGGREIRGSRRKEAGMKEKKFFSTKEVGELLNISIATVMRKFDKGLFFGKQNPITHERAISRESLIAFAEKFRISLAPFIPGPQRILLGGFDEPLMADLRQIFSGEEWLRVETIAHGADILINCSQNPPNLLILNGDLPVIPCRAVIESLRRRKDGHRLKILCLTQTIHLQENLAWGADDVLTKESLDRVALTKRAYALLDIPKFPPPVISKYQHHRSWPRMNLNIPAAIKVYRLAAASHTGRAGNAELVNISRGGAFLANIHLEKNELPGEPFKILLEVDQPLLQSFRAHCRVVRLQSNGSLTAGVEFVRISRSNREKIERISLR